MKYKNAKKNPKKFIPLSNIALLHCKSSISSNILFEIFKKSFWIKKYLVKLLIIFLNFSKCYKRFNKFKISIAKLIMINHKFDNDFKPIKHPKNIKIVNTFQFEMLEKYIKFFKKLRNFFFCKLYVKMKNRKQICFWDLFSVNRFLSKNSCFSVFC